MGDYCCVVRDEVAPRFCLRRCGSLLQPLMRGSKNQVEPSQESGVSHVYVRTLAASGEEEANLMQQCCWLLAGLAHENRAGSGHRSSRLSVCGPFSVLRTVLRCGISTTGVYRVVLKYPTRAFATPTHHCTHLAPDTTPASGLVSGEAREDNGRWNISRVRLCDHMIMNNDTKSLPQAWVERPVGLVGPLHPPMGRHRKSSWGRA